MFQKLHQFRNLLTRRVVRPLQQRVSSRRGQTALVLILIIALALVIYAASLNWSRVTQYKTLTIMGSNLSASSMASIISSYGEQQLQVTLGGRPKYCKRTNFLVMLATLVIVIILVVITIVTWGATLPILLIGIAAIALAATALVINLTVIQPGLTSLWNKMQDALLTMEDKVVENGIMTGLQSSVTDQTHIFDHFDMDLDGQWVDSLGRNNVIGGPDKISRFAYFYTMRLKQLEPIRVPEINAFMSSLEELIEDNPYKKAGSGCTQTQKDMGSVACEEPDNFGLFDPGCNGQNPPSPYCNSCCVPLKDAYGIERPSECAADNPVASVCLTGGSYPATSSQGTPYYPFQYDPFYENYDNTFLSFREKLGVDDEHPLYTKDPTNPNGLQGIDTTAPATGAFREDDASGFYTELPDKRKGIYPFFWDMANLRSAPVTEVTITPPTPPTQPGGGGEVLGGGSEIPPGDGTEIPPVVLPSDQQLPPEVFPAPAPPDPQPPPITNDPAVIINAGATEGPVTHRASGFLFPGVGAWFSEYPLPPNVMPLAAALKPRFIREGGSDILGNGYAVNQAFGAESEILLPDNFGYPDPLKKNSPGEDGDWSKWDNYVRDLAQKIKASGRKVRWDIWNEPDLYMFWYASEAQYLEMWRRTVNILREVDPTAVIVGPSLGHYNPTKLYQYMQFFKDNKVLPDVVSWHELDGGWGEIPDISGHLREVKSSLSSLGLSINRFEINESIQQVMQYSPGVYVGTIGEMEQAKIEHAGRACWPDPETGSLNCYNATLNGLLTYPGRQPRPIYWAYKAYADITGQLVAVAPGNDVFGVAGYNPIGPQIKALLGTTSSQTSDRKVRLTNLDDANFPDGSVVQIIAQRIPGTSAALASLPVTINKNFLITNGAVEITLPDFDAYGAYVLTVRRPGGASGAAQQAENNAPTDAATGIAVTVKKAAAGAAVSAQPLAGAAVTSSSAVAIDFGADQGPATHRGSGFLWPWRSKDQAAAIFSAVQALKPKLIRQVFWLAVDTLSYTNALGAQVTILVPDGFGYQPWHPAPGDNGDWAPWENYVRSIVQQAQSIGFKPRWDIWNEPDYVQFWQRSEEQYLEAFVRAVHVIRSVDPQATIVGPSLSKYSPSTMGRFLTYFRDHNAVPNVISWHPLDSGNDAPAIRSEIADVKGWIGYLGLNVNRIELNETMQEPHFTSPGMHAWTMGEIESAKEVEVAARTCWPVNNTDSCLNSTIGGLLTPTDKQFRSIYWSYKAYADITGRMVAVSPYNDVWGVAGFDSSTGMAKILLGRKSFSSGNVPVLLANLDRAGFQNNTQIHVVAESIPDTPDPVQPAITLSEDYEVVDGNVNLTLPNVQGYGGYILTITSTDAGAYVPPPPPEITPPTTDPTDPSLPPGGGTDPGNGGLPGQPPVPPPEPVTVNIKTDNVIMMTADPATCLVPPGETATMTNCPNRFAAAPEMCSLEEYEKDLGTSKGFWWKPGMDHYCSQEYPYGDCAKRTGSCQSGPFTGTVPSCGCSSSPDHTVWHEDAVDSLVDGLTNFIGWGQKMLEMAKTNPTALYNSFPDWYTGAAHWIAPKCKPEWNCDSDVSARQPECSSCNPQDFDGYLLIWRDQLGGWIDLLDEWLYKRSFAKNDVLCLPPQGAAGSVPLPLPAGDLPSQKVSNPPLTLPKDRKGNDMAPVWGDLNDTIACLEAVTDPDVQVRVTYLKKLRDEAKAVRDVFYEGYQRFNEFLEPCRPNDELGNPQGCNKGHCVLNIRGKPAGGPAANLMCARQNFIQHTAQLSNFAIYGWMSPPVAGRANKNEHGYWHIVRVETFAPKRCYHYCWLDEFPKVRTYTKWKFLDQYRCFELVKTDGLVVSRVTRYDEDHDSPFARFANGQKIWNFRFGNPGVTPSQAASPANLEAACAPPSNYFSGTANESQLQIRNAFMINDNPAKDQNMKQACWDQVNALLDTGVQTTTCARYFLDNSIKHMSLKFTPCPAAVVEHVFDCAKKDGTPEACP